MKIKNKRVIKVEVPKVIWDAEMSIFNFRPILSTWMESIRNVVKQVKEEK